MKVGLKSIEEIKQAISPVIQNLGGELVDIEWAKKYGEDNLTVFVYFDGGTTLDDCERVHHAVDPVLDNLNPTGDAPYVLNISSPGLDRPFKAIRDFERNYGKMVEVKLFAPLKGKKLLEGILLNRDTYTTLISINDNELKIENSKIALVRPYINFNA